MAVIPGAVEEDVAFGKYVASRTPAAAHAGSGALEGESLQRMFPRSNQCNPSLDSATIWQGWRSMVGRYSRTRESPGAVEWGGRHLDCSTSRRNANSCHGSSPTTRGNRSFHDDCYCIQDAYRSAARRGAAQSVSVFLLSDAKAEMEGSAHCWHVPPPTSYKEYENGSMLKGK